MLQRQDADHEETAPHAATLLIHRLACSLVGQTQTIQFTRGTKVHHAYGVEEASEECRCNFGLNPAYRAIVLSGPLQCTGVDRAAEVRVVELTSHRFFLATLFLPQLASSLAAPHPLIRAYLRAAVAFHEARTGGQNHRQATTSQSHPGDCLQPTLVPRFGFRQRLMRGVRCPVRRDFWEEGRPIS